MSVTPIDEQRTDMPMLRTDVYGFTVHPESSQRQTCEEDCNPV